MLKPPVMNMSRYLTKSKSSYANRSFVADADAHGALCTETKRTTLSRLPTATAQMLNASLDIKSWESCLDYWLLCIIFVL